MLADDVSHTASVLAWMLYQALDRLRRLLIRVLDQNAKLLPAGINILDLLTGAFAQVAVAAARRADTLASW